MPVALATAVLGVGASGVAIAVVSAVISVGLAYLSKSLFTPAGQDDTPPADQGILTNTSSNSAPVPVIYGYRKVGGSKVYQAVTNNNKDFWVAVVIGEGEIQGIEKIYIDDDEVVLDTNSPNAYITVTDSFDSVAVTTIVSGTRYKITALNNENWSSVGGSATAKVGNIFTANGAATDVQLNNLGDAAEVKARYAGKCEFFYRTGTNTQAAITKSDFNNDTYFPTNWDSDKRLFGLAYVMCKFSYDRDVFRGIPNITMDVKGIKVPDIKNNAANKKWDRNPAAIMYDYLTNPVYGRNLDATQMDLTSFQAAYDVCETALTITGTAPPKSLEAILGTSEQKLYRLDGVVNVDDNTFNNTKKILSACRAFLIFSAGKYKMVIDKFEGDFSRTNVDATARVPTTIPFLFDEGNTIGAMDITLGDKSNTYNRARYSFFNPQKNWQYDTVYFDDATTRTNSDRGLVLEQSIRMEFVASRYCAQEIVRQNLRQSRQQIIVGFQTNISALANDVGDIVDITNENAGWYLKQFRLLKLELQEDGNVKVVMVEYNPGVYDTSANNLAFENDTADTNLPNPFATSNNPDTPSVENAVLTGRSTTGSDVQVGRVKVSWGEVPDPFIDYYELQYAVLDQAGTTTSSIVTGKVYQIKSTVSTDWTTLIGGQTTGATSSVSTGDYFKAVSTIGNIASLGTVQESLEDSSGYSTVNVPSSQIDVNGDSVEFVENLSPTTGYAFRVRYVRTNSIQSGYSGVQRFVTAGVETNDGAPGEDAVTLRITTNNGTVLREDIASTTLTASVVIGSTQQSDAAHTSYEYVWKHSGSILCINDSTGQVLNDAGGDPLVVVGGSCSIGVPADSTNVSNTRGGGNRTVIVGREDVLSAAQFVCEVANIPD